MDNKYWKGAAVTLVILIVSGIIYTTISKWITEKEPDLRLGIYDPCTMHGSTNVNQYLITWNEGKANGIDLQLVLKSASERFVDGITIETLLPLECNRKNDTQNNVVLKCGNLKPGGRISFYLNYKVPPLRYDEIFIFANDTSPRKGALGSAFCQRGFLP